MNIYDKAIEKVDWIFSNSKIPNYELSSICVALERAKKVEELLGLYKQLSGIEQDIEYLCGLRDCMIEHSVEEPMEHIYSGIKESKINRDDILKQIKALEEELE